MLSTDTEHLALVLLIANDTILYIAEMHASG